MKSMYEEGMTADDLADKASCYLWQALWFVTRIELGREVKDLHERGLTTRRIAEKLGVSQSFASRALRGWYAV